MKTMMVVMSLLSASLLLPTSGLADKGRHHKDDDQDWARHHKDDDFNWAQSRIKIGFRISPVDLNLRHKNPLLVGLGSYLVNAVGGCNDCHTEPNYQEGGNPFEGEPEIINTAGYLAGGRSFGPVIVSANITPDEYGRPAGLTFQEFEYVMRTGHDPDDPTGQTLLQVMPWPVYRNMSDLDLRAIYEYLSAIPMIPSTE